MSIYTAQEPCAYNRGVFPDYHHSRLGHCNESITLSWQARRRPSIPPAGIRVGTQRLLVNVAPQPIPRLLDCLFDAYLATRQAIRNDIEEPL